LRCAVRRDIPLAPFTSFRIGGPAKILVEPATADELGQVFEIIRAENISFFYLGHGSNILVADDGFDGIVIRAIGELCAIGKRDDKIFAGPGARLLLLTTHAAHLALSGMEPLSGIPGSVGGGLYMNAGAYGGEISDTLIEVDVLTSDGKKITLKTSDVGFGYRSAPHLQDKIILESRYRLKPADSAIIYNEMYRVWKLRREKQPLEYPSAGSIFKRPPGDFAGRLIEAVGGKGMRVGGAMVSAKHAGIFVNVGGATAKDVAGLVREIRSRVFAQFGILLENEVKPIGFKNDPFAIPR
jgi:UDP-N-acetylmuramate dehydrogenase